MEKQDKVSPCENFFIHILKQKSAKNDFVERKRNLPWLESLIYEFSHDNRVVSKKSCVCQT